MSDVLTSARNDAAFPRPTSLYQPERYTVSLVDSSSYSPFPTIAGARADPFGLNAYLLHPEDQIWAYIAPAPSTEPYSPPQSKEKAQGDAEEGQKPKLGLKKIKSNAALRKGSPLAQTSVVPPGVNELDVQRELVRRRSKSMDSGSSGVSPVKRDAPAPPAPLALPTQDQKTGSVGKKGLGKLFSRRKSIPNMVAAVTNELPPVPRIPVSATASSSASDLSTPSSNRSSLNLSDMATASSSSSSLNVLQTPVGSPPLEPDAFPAPSPKTEIDDGSLRRKGLRGWLGIKGARVQSPTDSAETSPVNTATAQSAVTAAQPVDPPSRILPTPEQEPYAWVGDQLRRASYRKLSQLRRPSTHPLAQQLRRQTSHLPNEVASSFEIGQIMYPRSVNYRDPSAGLAPAQRGLWCLLHVKLVLDSLDKGQLPAGPMNKRPPLMHSTSDKRARGMQDFVARPPFEDRHYVYYPDDVWSPVSIARPGFGVWDLDFSKYILALAESGEDDAPTWPHLPRPSFLGMDELPSTGEITDTLAPDTFSEEPAEDASPSVDSDNSHKAVSFTSVSSDESSSSIPSSVITTPPVLETEHVVPVIRIDLDDGASKGDAFELPEYQAESSFRRSRIVRQTWDDSDDEDAEPAKTLSSSLPKSESQTLPDLSKLPELAQPVSALPATHARHLRRISQPVTTQKEPATTLMKRRSQFDLNGDSHEKHQRAMQEVADARERRRALISGEVDRQAEGELRRAEEAKRRAASSGPTGSRNRLSTYSSSGVDEGQRLKSFTSDPATASHVKPLGSSSLGSTKRFHSFYEVPSTSRAGSTSSTKGASYPSPAQYAARLPSQTSRPAMSNSMSIGFANGIPYYPHGYQQPMQPVFYPTVSPSLGYHSSPHMSPAVIASTPFRQGLPSSKSALSLPDQRRSYRRAGHYA